MPTGKNRVPMAELRVALADAGLTDVQTCIQSGNVVAQSDLDPAGIGQLVHDTIKQKIGADITVITRTPEQIKRVLAGNPFPDADLSRLYYSLLSSPPAPELLQKFLELDCSPDELLVVDDTIYTLYATRLSDSKFTNNFFERKLKIAATTRNFNTMSRLVELCKQTD
jgi:uncharacterized protein (DUF1697 family)